MRKARFVATETVWYDDVPIPDNLKTSKEIIDYLKENIDDLSKYRTDSQIYEEGIYQAIIEDEDENETTITLDD